MYSRASRSSTLIFKDASLAVTFSQTLSSLFDAWQVECLAEDCLMLPTHQAQVQSSTGNGSGMVYPPIGPFFATSNGTGKSHTTLQSRICGPRGVTSFTIQTQTPIKSQVETTSNRTNGEANGSAIKPAASPSRWNTWEFYVYALVFLFAVPYMCWVPVQLSRGRIRLLTV